MKPISIIVIAAVLIGSSAVCRPDAAFAVLSEERIKNNIDPSQPADDLDLKWTGGNVSNVKLILPDGTELTPSSGSLNSAHFDKFADGKTVPAGAKATVKYDAVQQGTNPLPKLDKNSGDTFWTVGGTRFPNSVAFVGQPPSLSFQGLEAFATLINPESFPLIYSNIQLFRDNDIANFSIDRFDIPTGTPVFGGPTSVTLEPNESISLPFGKVEFGTYQLASADAAAATAPNDLFRVAAANVVPELSPQLLLGCALAGLAGLVSLRRRRSHSGCGAR